MKIKKESKIRVLENFYSLDYALFGKPVSEVDTCCPVFVEEYLSVKGALMSLVIEMYKLVKHAPKTITEEVTSKKLMKMARESAEIARENCKKLVTSKKGSEDVKESLRESISKTKKNLDIEKLVQEKIRMKAFSLAVDNLLIGRAIAESKKFDKLNTWNGRIIEDAYKVLRDNLVESAITIVENSIYPEPVQEITTQAMHNYLLGTGGSRIFLALKGDFRKCLSACKDREGKDAKNLCVQKCRNEYYEKVERKKLEIKRLKKSK